ncbi:hypothetical protein ABEV46_06605, partial [Geobacillus stearothermophilus]|uniref:hypothetical protein n=1 Tax=Geobacillus stearothermophilus TaxID=1422 RepID=UPI003D1AAC48
AAAGPKHREPMAAGTRQRKAEASGSPRRANVLHPEGCWHPEGEGYLTPSGGEPELDNEK